MSSQSELGEYRLPEVAAVLFKTSMPREEDEFLGRGIYVLHYKDYFLPAWEKDSYLVELSYTFPVHKRAEPDMVTKVKSALYEHVSQMLQYSRCISFHDASDVVTEFEVSITTNASGWRDSDDCHDRMIVIFPLYLKYIRHWRGRWVAGDTS